MNKYRIKATYNRYTVQRKGWFFWSNCLKEYCRAGDSYPKIFFSYADAKTALEKRLKDDAENEEYMQKVAAFKTRYYYPPLPDEEPVND
jgi:hypothetical protein